MSWRVAWERRLGYANFPHVPEKERSPVDLAGEEGKRREHPWRNRFLFEKDCEDFVAGVAVGVEKHKGRLSHPHPNHLVPWRNPICRKDFAD